MLLLRFYNWVNSNIPIYSKQKWELEGFEIQYFRISNILSKFITSRHSSSFKTLIQSLNLVCHPGHSRTLDVRSEINFRTAPRWINFKETVHVSFWSIWRESSLSWKLWFYSWVLWTVSLKFDSAGFLISDRTPTVRLCLWWSSTNWYDLHQSFWCYKFIKSQNLR